MSGLTMTVIVSIIGVVGTVSGALLGWVGFARSHKDQDRRKQEEVREETVRETTMLADVEYIKRRVDDIREEQKAQHTDLDDLTRRMIRVEESDKRAHKRIDELVK